MKVQKVKTLCWCSVFVLFGCISAVWAENEPKTTPNGGDLNNPDDQEVAMRFDQVPVQLEDLIKEKFPGTTEELPEDPAAAPDVQNDAHVGKGFMENLMGIKKGYHHGHHEGHHGHDMHHMFHGGGGFNFQMKQHPSSYGQHSSSYGQHSASYGQHPPYEHHQWTHHEGGALPSGLISQMQGCAGQPNQPLNAVLKCTSNSNTCKATCMANYQFPNGETTLLISCVEGEWIVQGAEWPQVPSCEPICMPKCQNNGICISPGECKCSENFRGPQCQYENKLCLQKPSLPSNSRQTCTSSQCTISCAKGYRFPDGTTVTNVVCREGEWTPKRGDWPTVPDCQPVCSPKCRNGGNCLSFNVCQCPPEFRGPQCQYSVDNCAPKKMKFNGGYNCSGTGDTISCTLYCPQGVNFDFQPAPVYTCSYAKGVFSPETVPKCVFGDNMDVISMGGYKQNTLIRTGQTISGGSWSFSGGGGGGYQEIEITKTRKYKDGGGYEIEGQQGEEFEVIQLPGVYNLYISNDVGIVFREPKASICMTWNGNKVKTFDGLIYSSPFYCSHTLIHDQVDGAFSVIVRACPLGAVQPCPHSLVIFLLNMMYTFEKVNGTVKFSSPKSEIPIPSQLTGMKVTMIGHKVKIVLESIQTSILWDTEKLVVVEASASLWNRTGGLCGTMDMDVRNDFISKTGAKQKLARTFVDSWRTPNVDVDKSKCIATQVEDIDTAKCDPEVRKKAKTVCEKLVKSSKFTNCLEKYNADVLVESCIADYCFCPVAEHPEECSCDGVSVFAQDCVFQGIEFEHGWRDMEICPHPCSDGRIYRACGPSSEPSCGVAVTNEKDPQCREGCFCPDGTIQHDGKCIDPFQCPCQLRGKSFKAGAQVKKDCNTCTCENGSWKCTDVSCGSRCGAIGDPHYVTFDGKRFDFMGKCSYRLFLTENVTVDAENVACPGSISEAMELNNTSRNMPKRTKAGNNDHKAGDNKHKNTNKKQESVTQGKRKETKNQPKTHERGRNKRRQASETPTADECHKKLNSGPEEIKRVHNEAPDTQRHKTQEHQGKKNEKQKNNCTKPKGESKPADEPPPHKERTKKTRPYITDTTPVPHPCQVNIENKSKAEKVCGKLKGKIFDDCHWYVDYMPFYEDCLYDVCACKGDDVNACLCPILSSYAAECARQGVVINWRLTITECGVKCPPGQVFEECGDSCALTCEDLQADYPCRKHCVEGCRCPDRQALNEDNECIPVGMCACAYKGLTFRPGYREVRPGNKFLELCKCSGATWDCVEAKDGDAEKYPAAADIRSKCLASNNEEFTTCEPIEPITCKNMHEIEESTPAECVAGCVCKKGFVLDMSTKKCVRPKDCSCHHGGISYKDGAKIKENCNTCECKGGAWKCTEHQCPGVCTSWGDSHFTTFDGKDFDFQGVCNYVLAKGSLGSTDGGFSVTIQNVLCGSLGETCSKSVHISIQGSNPESLTLSADSPIPGIKDSHDRQKSVQNTTLKSLLVYRAGIFVVVEAPELGLQVKWDRGTRVYITLTNQWRGKVQGLCGNFNSDIQDDFKTPSSGIETNPVIFGDSWKLQDYCPKTTEQVDSCAKHPHRTMWAQRKCGVLKTGAFQACHSEVPVDNFLKRCTHDTCACDQGGDCECLCTALAAYAHACALKGVPIRWRTPDLCPMQCDPECSSYNPCISTCPIETCDNAMPSGKDKWMCSEDSCVEGCKLKGCPEGQIYSNESYSDCVPRSTCKPICMEHEGILYYEGDVVSSDLCQTCRCSRGKKICSGAPCPVGVTTVEDMYITLRPYQEEDMKCISGWSGWINQDVSYVQDIVETSKKAQKIGDKEPLPSYLLMKNVEGGEGATCSPSKIAQIECRTVRGHKSPKSTGENCECSLERGLVCEGSCSDYRNSRSLRLRRNLRG
uniref:Putative hemolectin isoform b n=1 Tax=Lutzomyia longipalpis TaxID=7200 RepID=A0A7G3AKI1_LUTLO